MTKVNFHNVDFDDMDEHYEKNEKIRSTRGENMDSKFERDRDRNKSGRKGDRHKRDYVKVYSRMERED